MGKLDDIEVGCEVVLASRAGWSGRLSLRGGIVERVTKTQVVAMGGMRFNKRDGVEIGGGRGRFSTPDRLVQVTSELLREAAQDKAKEIAERKCRTISNLLARASDDDAIRMAAMLPDELMPPKETA